MAKILGIRAGLSCAWCRRGSSVAIEDRDRNRVRKWRRQWNRMVRRRRAEGWYLWHQSQSLHALCPVCLADAADGHLLCLEANVGVEGKICYVFWPAVLKVQGDLIRSNVASWHLKAMRKTTFDRLVAKGHRMRAMVGRELPRYVRYRTAANFRTDGLPQPPPERTFV